MSSTISNRILRRAIILFDAGDETKKWVRTHPLTIRPGDPGFNPGLPPVFKAAMVHTPPAEEITGKDRKNYREIIKNISAERKGREEREDMSPRWDVSNNTDPKDYIHPEGLTHQTGKPDHSVRQGEFFNPQNDQGKLTIKHNVGGTASTRRPLLRAGGKHPEDSAKIRTLALGRRDPYQWNRAASNANLVEPMQQSYTPKQGRQWTLKPQDEAAARNQVQDVRDSLAKTLADTHRTKLAVHKAGYNPTPDLVSAFNRHIDTRVREITGAHERSANMMVEHLSKRIRESLPTGTRDRVKSADEMMKPFINENSRQMTATEMDQLAGHTGLTNDQLLKAHKIYHQNLKIGTTFTGGEDVVRKQVLADTLKKFKYAPPAKPTYPYLKGLGKSALVAGGVGLGIYGAKKLWDQHHQNHKLEALIKVIQFAKGDPIPKFLLGKGGRFIGGVKPPVEDVADKAISVSLDPKHNFPRSWLSNTLRNTESIREDGMMRDHGRGKFARRFLGLDQTQLSLLNPQQRSTAASALLLARKGRNSIMREGIYGAAFERGKRLGAQGLPGAVHSAKKNAGHKAAVVIAAHKRVLGNLAEENQGLEKKVSSIGSDLRSTRANLDISNRNINIVGAAGLGVGGAAGYEIARRQHNGQNGRNGERRFGVRKALANEPDQNTGLHDIAIGAIEGTGSYALTDKLVKKFRPNWPGGRALTAGIVGGLSTGTVGYGLNRLIREYTKRQQEKNMSAILRTIRFDDAGGYSQLYPPKGKRISVIQDRYRKHIREQEINRHESNIFKSTLAGAAAGGLLHGKTGAGIGALAGAGTEVAAILSRRHKKDMFGDSTIPTRRIERAPYQIGGLVAGGLLANKAYTHGGALVSKLKSKFLLSSRIRTIHFDQASWKGEQNISKPGKLEKYLRHPVRRGAELQQYYGRASRLVRDLKAPRTASGKVLDERGRERTPEWKRPWVQRSIAVGTAAAGLAVAGVGFHKFKGSAMRGAFPGATDGEKFANSVFTGRLLAHATGNAPRQISQHPVAKWFRNIKTEIGQALHGATKGAGDIPEAISTPKGILQRNPHARGAEIDRLTDVGHKALDKAQQAHKNVEALKEPIGDPAKDMKKFLQDPYNVANDTSGKTVKKEIKTIPLSSRLRLHRFDIYSDQDWIRDQRGHSARIFSPYAQHPRHRRTNKEIEQDKPWWARHKTHEIFGTAAAIAAPVAAFLGGRHSLGHFPPPNNIVPFNPQIVKHVASAKGRVIRFEDKKGHPVLIGAGGGVAGLAGGITIPAGRKYREGEDITGVRVSRPHRTLPFLQHEGIGLNKDTIAEFYHTPDMGKEGRIGKVRVSDFGKGGQLRVLDKTTDPAAADRARWALGQTRRYSLPGIGSGKNCQQFTEEIRKGFVAPIPRQLRRGIIGAGLGVGAAYGGAKAYQRHTRNFAAKDNDNRWQRIGQNISSAVSTAGNKVRDLPWKKIGNESANAGRKAAIVGGIGAATLGAAFLPGALKIQRIGARNLRRAAQTKLSRTPLIRSVIKSPARDPNLSGKAVRDYVEGSQSILNRGIHGRLIGRFLQSAIQKPGGFPGRQLRGRLGMDDFGLEHFSRFRSGHLSALSHWGKEYKGLREAQHIDHPVWDKKLKRSIIKPASSDDKFAGQMARYASGRKATEDALESSLKGGMSEKEAFRNVTAKSGSKEVRGYMDQLAGEKKDPFTHYGRLSLISEGLVAGGSATAIGAHKAAARKKNAG